MLKKIFYILSLLFTLCILPSCSKKNDGKAVVITVDDFSAKWLKGNWQAEISSVKGIYQLNRNFKVTVKSDEEVEIIRQSGLKENCDMDGLRDEVFYYYVSDIPSLEDIEKLTYDGLKVEGDGLLYLNAAKDEISSEIKITQLDGRSEYFTFKMWREK